MFCHHTVLKVQTFFMACVKWTNCEGHAGDYVEGGIPQRFLLNKCQSQRKVEKKRFPADWEWPAENTKCLSVSDFHLYHPRTVDFLCSSNFSHSFQWTLHVEPCPSCGFSCPSPHPPEARPMSSAKERSQPWDLMDLHEN